MRAKGRSGCSPTCSRSRSAASWRATMSASRIWWLVVVSVLGALLGCKRPPEHRRLPSHRVAKGWCDGCTPWMQLKYELDIPDGLENLGGDLWTTPQTGATTVFIERSSQEKPPCDGDRVRTFAVRRDGYAVACGTRDDRVEVERVIFMPGYLARAHVATTMRCSVEIQDPQPGEDIETAMAICDSLVVHYPPPMVAVDFQDPHAFEPARRTRTELMFHDGQVATLELDLPRHYLETGNESKRVAFFGTGWSSDEAMIFVEVNPPQETADHCAGVPFTVVDGAKVCTVADQVRIASHLDLAPGRRAYCGVQFEALPVPEQERDAIAVCKSLRLLDMRDYRNR
ncbi:MAG TPA: hypothetical protein VGF94_21040 [Kofleriaceae bacterium]